MQTELKGKIAMVSGASKGIGRAIADALAEEGAILSLCARDAANVEAAAAEIRERYRVPCHATAADLTKDADRQRWFDATLEQCGTIDVLVNNAGATRNMPFYQASADAFSESMQLKFHGSVQMTRLVLPLMREKKRGSIVNIIGAGAMRPSPAGVIGASVGAALASFTTAMAADAAPHGVRVNAVSPGFVLTARRRAFIVALQQDKGITEEEAEKLSVAQIPMGRCAEPSEIASAVVFLASARAAYVTGVNIPVDGGFLIAI